MAKNKATPCTLLVNNRWGYVATPQQFPSIRAAVRCAHGDESTGWFAYRVCVGGKVVRRGYCHDYV